MKLKLKPFASKLSKKLAKNSPTLLTALGLSGMATTVIFACKATPKAIERIEEKRMEKGDDLTRLETVKAAAPVYLPALGMGVASAACIIGANHISTRRNAALATAYGISERALKEYQEQVVMDLGEGKERDIRDHLAKRRLEENPPKDGQIIITGDGDHLCYDSVSGRYFMSNIEKIRQIENRLNKDFLTEMYISLNEFYYELGLEPISIGEDIGWNLDDGLIDLGFSSQLAPDGRPCMVLQYHVGPRFDYKSGF